MTKINFRNSRSFFHPTRAHALATDWAATFANLPTVVLYLDLHIMNRLAERGEGEIPRYRTTRKGAKAQQHFQEIEKLMPEM